MHILLVDDDPLTLEVLRTALTGQGHEIETSNSGYDALCKLEKEKYDCIVSDVIMPELSGLVLANIVGHYYGSSLPILLMSSNSNVGFYVESYTKPKLDFIEKPVNMVTLFSKISSIENNRAATG